MESNWRPKVLVIDDNLSDLHYICGSLKEHCELFCATEGEAGLEAAKEALPDFILLDENVANQTGVSVLEALRNDPFTKNIRVVSITAFEGVKKLQNVYSNSADNKSSAKIPTENTLIDRLFGLQECAA